MIDLIIVLYALLIVGSSCWIYHRHSLKPRYRPLKEAGLLRKSPAIHFIQGTGRAKRDPLRRPQLRLAAYGYIHAVVTVALLFAGLAVIGRLEEVGWN